MFSTALDVKSLRKEVIKITSGASSLDKILGGGLETGSITEVFGEFRTGKTQLAHTLCVTSQLGFGMQGGQGKVIYLDTENNFRPERIEQVAQRFGLDTELTLENIVVGTASTSDEQMSMMAHICALLADPDQGPFRVLNKHMKQLSNVAQEFNIVVLIVNQCQADPGALAMFGPVIKPVGGHVIAHASTTRIMLKKGKAEQRIAKIFDSPLMPEEEATFAISSGGIVDI
jgi:meiotic recombination protein DMC1